MATLSPERNIAEIVTTKWNATAALTTDCPGGLHYELYQAPADGSATTRPYCIMDMPSGSIQKLMAGTTEEVIVRNVRFRVYGKQSEVKTAIATIRTTFNRVALSAPPDGAFNSCVQAPGGEAKIEMWQRDGEQVWQATIVFKITITLTS